MIRSDKMTIKTQEALAEAQGLATRTGHNSIVPEHLLRAFRLTNGKSDMVPKAVSRKVLRKVDIWFC